MGFGGEGGGGQKYFCITVVQHVQSYVSLSLIIIKWAFFLSLKITSTFHAPGVCVDIKIQVINVHVYIVARRLSMISTANYQVLACILWISYQVQGIDTHALKIIASIFQTVLIQ